MKKSGKDKTLQYQKGGKIETIYVDNKKDPRLKSYNDSLYLHNKYNSEKSKYLDFIKLSGYNPKYIEEWKTEGYINENVHPKIGAEKYGVLKNSGGGFIRDSKGTPLYYNFYPTLNGDSKKVYDNTKEGEILKKKYAVYKKPVQPYKYKKPEPKPKIEEKVNETIVQLIEQNQPIEQLVKKDPTLFLRQERPTINGTKVYTRKDEKSEWIERDDLFIPKKEQGGEVVYNPRDKEFKEWYNRNTLEGQNNIPYSNELDYDYYSFYKNGEYKNRNYNIKKHFPDTYKRPNHKTFSTESIYSTKENPGGIWRGEEFIPQYNPGGTVEPYQVIQPSIYPQNYGINSPYFSQQPPLFDGQVGSPYYSNQGDYINRGYKNNFNNQSAALERRESFETKNGIDKGKLSTGLGIAGDSLSTGAQLMGSLGKEGSGIKAWGEGATKGTQIAGAITEPIKNIPVIGQAIDAAGKAAGFIIGGALSLRRQNIEKEENKYYDQLKEFNERNSQPITAPNNYGSYMAEFGINTGTKNNPLIEEILNDFRNYLAQIQNT